jgi:phage terminase small subunit
MYCRENMAKTKLKFDDDDLLGDEQTLPALSKEHEDFCQAVVALGSPSEAYRQTVALSPATKPTSIWVESSKLMARPNIRQRISELKAKAAEYAHITPGRIIAEIGKLAFFDIRNTLDADGNPIPIHKLDGNTAAAIAGVDLSVDKVNADITTTVMKMKFADKRAALADLTKIYGMNIDKHEVTGANGTPLVPEASDTETARRVAFLLSQGLEAQ